MAVVVKELIEKLTKLEKDGFGDYEVRMLLDYDNPFSGEWINVDEITVIKSDKCFGGVYFVKG